MASTAPAEANARDASFTRRAIDLCTVTTVCALRERPAWDALEQTLLYALKRHSAELHIELEPDCLRIRHLLPAGFDESRLALTHPLNDAIRALQQQMWPLFDRRLSRSGWFLFAVDAEKFLFRLDMVSTTNGNSYVLHRLHNTRNPLQSLDELMPCVKQLSRLRSLLDHPSGLIALAGHSFAGRLALCRAIAQTMVSPDRKIVMAETDYHPAVPRTTQIVVAKHPTNEQLASWQMGCDMSANSIITPSTEHANSALIGKACEECLVVQGVAAHSAANALKRLLAAGIKPEMIAASLKAIVIGYQIGHVCEHCKVPSKPSDIENTWVGRHSPMREGAIKDWLQERLADTFFVAPGCAQCSQTGISEMKHHMQIVDIGQDIQDALYDGDVRFAIRTLNDAEYLPQLLLKQAQQGNIPLKEAIRLSNRVN